MVIVQSHDILLVKVAERYFDDRRATFTFEPMLRMRRHGKHLSDQELYSSRLSIRFDRRGRVAIHKHPLLRAMPVILKTEPLAWLDVDRF